MSRGLCCPDDPGGKAVLFVESEWGRRGETSGEGLGRECK